MQNRNMAKKEKHPLCREVTHTQYTGIKKIGDKGPQSWLQREIVQLDKYFLKGKMGYPTVNDEYIKRSAQPHITPIIGGGVALFCIILVTYFSVKDGSFGKSPDIYIYRFVVNSTFLYNLLYHFT